MALSKAESKIEELSMELNSNQGKIEAFRVQNTDIIQMLEDKLKAKTKALYESEAKVEKLTMVKHANEGRIEALRESNSVEFQTLEAEAKRNNLALTEAKTRVKELEMHLNSITSKVETSEIKFRETKETLDTAKFENGTLKLEAVQNATKIQELEEFNVNARKFRDQLVIRIFNITGEDLQSILKLTNEELLSKFSETLLEDLTDLKSKLNIQTKKRESYEIQHEEMMNLLNLQMEDRRFENILPAIQDLKNMCDQSETNHYSNANDQIDSYSNGKE